mmetsp:Transcript_25369/g.35569  ORF Transcript_25369/g.35569 Transcript_25369/m.35569 type:complete len:164 (-) Transcript_25369:59-550(-)
MKIVLVCFLLLVGCLGDHSIPAVPFNETIIQKQITDCGGGYYCDAGYQCCYDSGTVFCCSNSYSCCIGYWCCAEGYSCCTYQLCCGGDYYCAGTYCELNPYAPPAGGGSSGLSTWAIVGIVAGCVSVAIVFLWFLCKKDKSADDVQTVVDTVNNVASTFQQNL